MPDICTSTCAPCAIQKIALKLIIGAKTRPFCAHAWVEHDGTVINDDPALRNKLAVLLEC
ncbi:lasso peptide biosynthesis B2 protein [Phyllobacterium zundukense]|uniref:lasso peptide biosynthesis B2 protein n=1 Tax=Phyllobacterium zundukense TaxID=1867719 RepID=UPI003965B655